MSGRIEILNRPIEVPTSPDECALLLAVPLERMGMGADLMASNKDFVRSLARSKGILTRQGMRMSVEGFWREHYEPVAKYAIEVAELVTEKGVQVTRAAGPGEFAKAIRSHKVITLVAHWRPPLFQGKDVVDVGLFLQYRDGLRARSSLSPGADLSAEQLASVLEINVDPADLTASDKLAEALNTALLSAVPQENATRGGVETRAQIAFEKSRARLCEIFQGAFTGGAAVELADGMHDVPELAALIPEDWRGTLDLTVCNSTFLGNAVRLRARGAVVLMNEELTDLQMRLALYKQVIRMLSHRKQSYTRCMLDMRAYLA